MRTPSPVKFGSVFQSEWVFVKSRAAGSVGSVLSANAAAAKYAKTLRHNTMCLA
jgi:hypothetical protein